MQTVCFRGDFSAKDYSFQVNMSSAWPIAEVAAEAAFIASTLGAALYLAVTHGIHLWYLATQLLVLEGQM